MVILITVVFSAVIFRYIIKSPIPWSFEVARYLNIWLVFFGLYYLERDNEFLKVDFVLQFLPENYLKYINLLMQFLKIAVEVLLVFIGFLFITKITNQKTAALRIPMWIAYLSCPVGMIILLTISVRKVYYKVKNIRVEEIIKKYRRLKDKEVYKQ